MVGKLILLCGVWGFLLINEVPKIIRQQHAILLTYVIMLLISAYLSMIFLLELNWYNLDDLVRVLFYPLGKRISDSLQ